MRVDHQLCTENALKFILYILIFVIERFFFFDFFLCLLDVISFLYIRLILCPLFYLN